MVVSGAYNRRVIGSWSCLRKKMVSLRADECQRICIAETLPDPLWDTLKKIFEDTGKNTKLIWHMFTVDTFYLQVRIPPDNTSRLNTNEIRSY